MMDQDSDVELVMEEVAPPAKIAKTEQAAAVDTDRKKRMELFDKLVKADGDWHGLPVANTPAAREQFAVHGNITCLACCGPVSVGRFPRNFHITHIAATK